MAPENHCPAVPLLYGRGMLRRVVPRTIFLTFALAAFFVATEVSRAAAVDVGHSTNFSAISTDAAGGAIKKFTVAPGIKVDLFATEPQLENPVAISVDERGRVFVAETHRYRTAIFDVTVKTNWLLRDLSLRTVGDRDAFLRETFATNLSVLTRESEQIRLVEDRDGDGRADHSSVFVHHGPKPPLGGHGDELGRWKRGDHFFSDTMDAQIRAATQPTPVQPKKKFRIMIGVELMCPRWIETKVGRK